MNSLEQRHLLRICRKHELDPQEIDSTLTYYENKEHLLSLAGQLQQISALDKPKQWDAGFESWAQYARDHVLEFFVSQASPLPSKLQPTSGAFSLTSYIASQAGR